MALHNKTIVVTGCCSGIGADFAKLARQQGARVVGMDRNAPTLTLDGFIQVDLGDPAAIDIAVAQLPAQVDALANIAGVPGTAPAELVGRVNYLGLRHLTQRVLERMPEGAPSSTSPPSWAPSGPSGWRSTAPWAPSPVSRRARSGSPATRCPRRPATSISRRR